MAVRVRSSAPRPKRMRPDVGYRCLHKWVARWKGRAALHPCAHADDTCRGLVEWANVSGEYHRDLNDYMALCRSHHRRFDNRRVLS